MLIRKDDRYSGCSPNCKRYSSEYLCYLLIAAYRGTAAISFLYCQKY